MQKLRLEELLRYTLSGALFLVALMLRWPTISLGPLRADKGLGEASKALGLVLLVGALIYSLHRAIVFPCLLFPTALSFASLIGAYPFSRKFWIPFTVSDVERRMDDDRFALRAQKDTLFDVWSEWGSQVHFLYCSGEAVLLALGIGHILGGYEHRKMLLVTSGILLTAGLISQVNLIYRVNAVWKASIESKLRSVPATARPGSC
jgi:hypothetical protein